MTSSSGASSTPRLLDSIINGFRILGHPLSRMMTAGDVQQLQLSDSVGDGRSFAISPRIHASFIGNVLPSKNRGRRESRVPAAPAASRAKLSEAHERSHHRFRRIQPAFPAQWF
jgi:hypothetical protein